MQLLVPQLGAIFVPILKNASRVLTQAIMDKWPDSTTVGPDYPGNRVVMWRDPKDRIESTYCFMRDQGMDVPFARWVYEVCMEGLRDPHLKPQASFCDNPQEIFKWDFEGFAKFFKLKKLPQENESGTYPTEWDLRAEQAFYSAYRLDLRLWRGFSSYAETFRQKAAAAEPKEETQDEC